LPARRPARILSRHRDQHHDRVYAAEQFSNTVSVTDPVDNKLLGVIRLGDPQPAISARSTREGARHAWAIRRITTRSVVSIGSNSVTFIDTRPIR